MDGHAIVLAPDDVLDVALLALLEQCERQPDATVGIADREPQPQFARDGPQRGDALLRRAVLVPPGGAERGKATDRDEDDERHARRRP
jgi:hypothetical protein